jgi:hypothetical protein
LFHGTGGTTIMPSLRGLFASRAASRRQRKAIASVPGLRPARPFEIRRRASMAFKRVAAAEVLSPKVYIMSATGPTVRPDTFYCRAMAQMQNRNVSEPKEVTCRKCNARPRLAHNLLNPRTGGYLRMYKCECGVRRLRWRPQSFPCRRRRCT